MTIQEPSIMHNYTNTIKYYTDDTTYKHEHHPFETPQTSLPICWTPNKPYYVTLWDLKHAGHSITIPAPKPAHRSPKHNRTEIREELRRLLKDWIWSQSCRKQAFLTHCASHLVSFGTVETTGIQETAWSRQEWPSADPAKFLQQIASKYGSPNGSSNFSH